MITSTSLSNNTFRADDGRHCQIGNYFFVIASIIGIAVKNGYSYGFTKWVNQGYFVNSLPIINEVTYSKLKHYKITPNFKGFDVGFCGFDFPDDSVLLGSFGSEEYFKHCEDLIKHYFTMKDLCEPYKDSIIIHYREFAPSDYKIFAKINHNYFHKALEQLPNKRVIVVTNNILAAKNTIGRDDFEYVSNSPIMDFYLLTKADYFIGSNSTFSWWGAWLSNAKKIIMPSQWFTGDFKDCPMEKFYCDDWIEV